jgi:Lon protease-like protein
MVRAADDHAPMKLEIPEKAAVMVLPGATLFPQALLPLYIFEPRYRRMLAEALETHRMFCIGLIRPGGDELVTEDEFFETGCIGLIRACVTNRDGTSNLILQGLSRVRFHEVREEQAFREADLEILKTEALDPLHEDALRAKLVEMVQELQRNGLEMPKQIQQYLRHSCSLELLVDLITYNFLSDPFLRQEILEEASLPKRLILLRRHLAGQYA